MNKEELRKEIMGLTDFDLDKFTDKEYKDNAFFIFGVFVDRIKELEADIVVYNEGAVKDWEERVLLNNRIRELKEIK